MKAHTVNSEYEKISFQEPAPTSVDLLDASTPLRMAEHEQPTVTFPPNQPAVKPGASLRREATLVGVLTIICTAVFWILISYLRTH